MRRQRSVCSYHRRSGLSRVTNTRTISPSRTNLYHCCSINFSRMISHHREAEYRAYIYRQRIQERRAYRSLSPSPNRKNTRIRIDNSGWFGVKREYRRGERRRIPNLSSPWPFIGRLKYRHAGGRDRFSSRCNLQRVTSNGQIQVRLLNAARARTCKLGARVPV